MTRLMQTDSRAILLTAAFTVCALTLGAGCVVTVEDGLPVTPQRPTLSSDTSTAAVGSFELEAGVALDPGSAFSAPVSVKYGAGPRTELFVGLSPYNYVERIGDDGGGFGDTFVGVRHRFWENAQGTSAALRWATKLPTGAENEGLSSGEVDFAGAGIVTHVVDDRTSVTAYYELGVLGDPTRAGTDTQHALAIAASRSLTGDLGVFAEVSQVSAPGDIDPLVAIVGVTRTLRPSLVLDFGLGTGLNADAPDTVFTVGLTLNFGRPGR